MSDQEEVTDEAEEDWEPDENTVILTNEKTRLVTVIKEYQAAFKMTPDCYDDEGGCSAENAATLDALELIARDCALMSLSLVKDKSSIDYFLSNVNHAVVLARKHAARDPREDAPVPVGPND